MAVVVMKTRTTTPLEESFICQHARKLRRKGWSWGAIGRNFNVGENWLRRRIEPGFMERQREKGKRLRGNGEYKREVRHSRWERRIMEFKPIPQPEDTRDFTQRFFGDPLPGRSALDRKQQ